MSDTNQISLSSIDPGNWAERELQHAALVETIRPANKTVLFDALTRAGITRVVVYFDGYGDSGQVEGIEVKAGDGHAELPTGEIEIAQVHWGSPDIVRATFPLRHAIEQLTYDFLEDTHCGWENNQGSYGEFTFDVAKRTIMLDYNERIDASEYTQHVF